MALAVSTQNGPPMIGHDSFGRLETVTGPFHPVLILESPTLSHAFQNHFPELTFDVCSSLDLAERLFSAKPYWAWIASVQIAAMRDFALLKRNRSGFPATPCLITVETSEKALAYQALEQGALSCIFKPVSRDLAVPTLQAALWVYQYRTKVALEKHKLEVLKQRRGGLLDGRPGEVERANLVTLRIEQLEGTIDAFESTIATVENSLRYLQGTLDDMEQTARARAFERLHVPRQ